jgi:glycosyltransferase
MRVGGVSNKSISNIIQKTREDLLIARTNGFYSYVTILFKNLRKVGQFL